MQVVVKQVSTRKELKAFVHFPNKLYRGNPYYVPQIESMDRDTLNPKKNHAFEVCESVCWLAYDEKGKVVGRVAGIINRRYNEKTGEKVCRFGWIDFIDNQDVSRALLRTVERYARNRGMNIVSGPMGFLEFDPAGVLVEGFDQLPTAYGKYNAPYYEKHLMDLGYAKDVDFVEYRILVPDVIPERYARMAHLVAVKYDLHEAPITNRADAESPRWHAPFRLVSSDESFEEERHHRPVAHSHRRKIQEQRRECHDFRHPSRCRRLWACSQCRLQGSLYQLGRCH